MQKITPSRLILTAGTLAALALPLVSFATSHVIDSVGDVGSFIINTINNVLVPVVFAIAFIVFLWGAFTTFVVGAGDEEVKTKGKNLMLWGLIGFFVMASVWGLVNILTGTAPLDQTIVKPPAAGGIIR